jgi:hypothetical protein
MFRLGLLLLCVGCLPIWANSQRAPKCKRPKVDVPVRRPIVTDTVALKQTLADSLIRLLVNEEMASLAVNRVIERAKAVYGEVPALVFEQFRTSQQGDVRIDVLRPLYLKYLSLVQLRSTLAFYHTPTGKNWLKVQPIISRESIAASQSYAESLAAALVQYLRERGYLPHP